MNRKLNIFISSVAVLAMLASCKEVDPLAGTELGTMGVLSVTAAFTGEVYESDPNASFSATPDENGKIVIEVPYFYPQNSDNEVPIDLLTNMRVTASLATGTYIEPGVGIMDLTQTHHFTAYDAAGRTIDYELTAEITKLSGCIFDSFKVISAGVEYVGIINPSTHVISIMSPGVLTGCTLEYAASPHATVSGYTEGMDIDDGTKFTVTAHNGVDKTEYTISFAQPEKIGYGARIGSENNLWTKYMNSGSLGFELTDEDSPITLAAQGDYLYLLAGGTGTIYQINRKTGDYIGNVTLPEGYTATSITADEAGNIVFAADASSEFKVYYTESFESTPVELITYTNATGGSNIGHVRVAGNVKEQAVVSATVAGVAPTGLVWQITDGIAGAPNKTSGIAGGTLWNAYNGCFAPASSDLADGVFAIGYWTVYELYHSSNLASYSAVIDPDVPNTDPNSLYTVSFNNARYLVFGAAAFWTYSPSPYFTIVESSTPTSEAMNSAILYTVPYDDLKLGGFVGNNSSTSYASADVTAIVSEDGYYLDVYIADKYYGVIACYEFDCIQQ